MTPQSEWKWFGVAAHFIGGISCEFHLATQVGSVLVSTVGQYKLPFKKDGYAAIGYQRVDRARYPEKIRRDCLGCARRFACNEICFAKNLRIEVLAA